VRARARAIGEAQISVADFIGKDPSERRAAMPPPVDRLAASAAATFFDCGAILSKLVKDSRNNLCCESLRG
jgi:hypothetical protein